jgi:glycerophosphoryl diester phosphodiesterase
MGARVVGHRGGRGEGWPPENTLDAFEHAYRQGARAIELDVRSCSTGEVVVFHDARLTRMTDGKDARRVSDVALVELRAIDLHAPGARAPTLGQALAWAESRGVLVNVEMKHDVERRRDLVRAVAQAIARSRAEVLLSSFDPRLLAWAAVAAPRVPRALLTDPTQGGYAAALRELARPPALTGVHVERTQTSPEAVARWKARGLRVGVWTVNDPREAVDLARLGVDLLITDAPAALLAALEDLQGH